MTRRTSDPVAAEAKARQAAVQERQAFIDAAAIALWARGVPPAKALKLSEEFWNERERNRQASR